MAATKYQVLYRYTNPNSNQFVLNNTDVEYKPVMELYHDKHKLAIGTEEEILVGNNEKSNLIIEGNSTANDNYNMLFKFAGTKRINKRVWVPKTIGYVVRDKEAVRSLTTDAVNGDFSGKYLLMEGSSIETGLIVAKENPVPKNGITIVQSDAKNYTYFKDTTELENVITNKVVVQLTSTNVSDFITTDSFSGFDNTSSKRQSISGKMNITIKVGSDVQLTDIAYYTPKTQGYNSNKASNAVLSDVYEMLVANGGDVYSEVKIKPEQVETYEIPAHYEEVAEYPYIVADTYERIEQSPWFILSTHSSLTSALEKVKAVVKSVGIENVKLIKTVPSEQFIKIK